MVGHCHETVLVESWLSSTTKKSNCAQSTLQTKLVLNSLVFSVTLCLWSMDGATDDQNRYLSDRHLQW